MDGEDVASGCLCLIPCFDLIFKIHLPDLGYPSSKGRRHQERTSYDAGESTQHDLSNIDILLIPATYHSRVIIASIPSAKKAMGSSFPFSVPPHNRGKKASLINSHHPQSSRNAKKTPSLRKYIHRNRDQGMDPSRSSMSVILHNSYIHNIYIVPSNSFVMTANSPT